MQAKTRRFALVALVGGVAFTAALTVGAPAFADSDSGQPLCHAAGPHFVSLSPPSHEILNPNGHGSHADDIDPPFDYDGGHFPGLNWTTQGQAIWNNGKCGRGMLRSRRRAPPEFVDRAEHELQHRREHQLVEPRAPTKAPACRPTQSTNSSTEQSTSSSTEESTSSSSQSTDESTSSSSQSTDDSTSSSTDDNTDASTDQHSSSSTEESTSSSSQNTDDSTSSSDQTPPPGSSADDSTTDPTVPTEVAAVTIDGTQPPTDSPKGATPAPVVSPAGADHLARTGNGLVEPMTLAGILALGLGTGLVVVAARRRVHSN